MSSERVTEVVVWSKYNPGPEEDELVKFLSEQEGLLSSGILFLLIEDLSLL